MWTVFGRRFFISTVTVPFVLAVQFISSKTGTGDFPIRSSLSEAVPWRKSGQWTSLNVQWMLILNRSGQQTVLIERNGQQTVLIKRNGQQTALIKRNGQQTSRTDTKNVYPTIPFRQTNDFLAVKEQSRNILSSQLVCLVPNQLDPRHKPYVVQFNRSNGFFWHQTKILLFDKSAVPTY